MGEAAKKRRAAEAKAAKKAKKETEQKAQPAAPTGSDSLFAGAEPPDSSASKHLRKPRETSQKIPGPRIPSSSISTRRSTRSGSTSAIVSLESGEQRLSDTRHTASIATRQRRTTAAAAEALLRQVQLIEDTDSDEEEISDGEADREMDENDHGELELFIDNNESSINILNLVELDDGEIEVATSGELGQAPKRAPAAPVCAKKPSAKVQVFVEEDEEESSDEELSK